MKDDKINNLREELMQEIKTISKDVQDIKISIASLPEALSEKFDTKYASKALEDDVKRLKEKNEQRNYDWLKYVIMLGVGALLAYLGLS